MATTVVHTCNTRTTMAISLNMGDDGRQGPRGIFLFFFSWLPLLILFLSFYFIVSLIQMY